MSVKSRIAELNSRLADTLTEKGVEATANETTTALIGKVGQIEQGGTVEGVVIPKDYFAYDSASGSIYNPVFYPTITAKDLEGLKKTRVGAFSGWYLESLELPQSLTRILLQAFGNCTIKQPFVIPDTVTELGAQAFQNSKIKHITVGKNVTSMLGALFNGSTVETLIIRGDIRSAISNAFTGTTKLTNISFGGKIYCSIVFGNSPFTPESIQNIIDALADLTGQETQTLTLNADHVLTDEQKAAITLKNWTLVQ